MSLPPMMVMQYVVTPPSPSHPRPQAFTVNTNSSLSMCQYPNNRASHHAPSNIVNIQQIALFEGPYQIIIESSPTLTVKSICTSNIQSSLNPNFHFTLHNLLHVLTITQHMPNVSKFAPDNSAFFQFHPNFCLVKSQATNEVFVKGKLDANGLYQFPAFLPKIISFSIFPTPLHKELPLAQLLIFHHLSHLFLNHHLCHSLTNTHHPMVPKQSPFPLLSQLHNTLILVHLVCTKFLLQVSIHHVIGIRQLHLIQVIPQTLATLSTPFHIPTLILHLAFLTYL